MKNDALATYLNDHFGGSVGAVEILDHLIETYEDLPIAGFCQQLRDEVSRDQETLREIMRALGVSESGMRKAGAWLVEKFSRAKMRVKGEEVGEPGLVLALESLVLGIKGKELLWRTLGVLRPTWPPLDRFDFATLRESAINQGARTDAERLRVAQAAYQPES